jgi:antitoxin HicB
MTENFNFSVVLEPQEDGGFTVLIPALPEVVTEGDTEEVRSPRHLRLTVPR